MASDGSTELCHLLEAILPDKTPGTNEDARKNDTEVDYLGLFLKRFESHRKFTAAEQETDFQKLLSYIRVYRITSEWMTGAPKQHKLRVLKCVRVLLRDVKLLQTFAESTGCLVTIVQELQSVSSQYINDISGEETETVQDTLMELTSIVQKCSSLTSTHKPFITAGSLELLAMLTESPDLPILHSTISSLINFGKTGPGLSAISNLDLCESMVTIMLHMDSASQQLASDLLLLLSQQPSTQQQIKESDLLPSLLTLFKGKDPHLQQRIIASLERLLEDAELLEEFRQAGGIPLVLSLLVKEEARNGKANEKEQSKHISLLCASCSLLTRLSINNACAVEIVKSNGIYLLATHIMPSADETSSNGTSLLLQQQALRAMRFLFSLERNRQLFKQLFPAHLLEKFIDVGHYVYGLSQYHQLATIFASLPPHEATSIQEKVAALNQSNEPLCTIGSYCVLELLGSGAFGSVYKVRKGHSGNLYAMKEISTAHPLLGKTTYTRQESIGEIMSEVAMTKEQLVHPNIVSYCKCFQEGQHLYIVMELLEGAPLSEHITSLKEKSLRFSEERIWIIFTQIIRALRYLHKNKHIVHRDLKPANIMLGENDKLTITDFGLAKQKQKEFSVMNSTVGTMLYWCPELIQNEEYNEKADIWAAGCILYEMAALKAPFHSSNNILALATKIAEVDYERLPDGVYSALVGDVIEQCLSYDKSVRPDSVQVGSLVAGKLMQQMDSLAQQRDGLHRKLNKEKEKRIRHLHDAVSSELKYQQLLAHGRTGSARKRLSFAGTDGGSMSLASSLAISSPFTSDGITESLAEVVHPEITFSPVSDSVFEDEPTQLPRKSTSAGLIRSVHSPQQQRQSRASIASASPSLRTWKRSFCEEEMTMRHSRPSSLSPVPGARRHSGVLSISSKHVREVTDPVGGLLSQIHKIVYLSKLSLSAGTSNPGLTIVRQYERALFGKDSQAANLKIEMRKLSTCSSESVSILPPCPTLLTRALRETSVSKGSDHSTSPAPADSDHPTYEQLHAIIENLLIKHSYD